MAESHKGVSSTANMKNRRASLDEDFGKDFLTCWNFSRLGKDALNFDVETVPQSGKKFNFDKLVDFEVGNNFDKLSSFKMEMPDLVFSTPLKKAQKEKEKSSDEFVQGKNESKKDKFSFDFDFNELGKFDLGSKLLTEEKEATARSTKRPEDIGTNSSVNQDKGPNQMGNLDMKMDILRSNENKAPSEAENLSPSRPTKLIGQGMATGSRSWKMTFGDMPQEVGTSAKMHSISIKENKEEATPSSKENTEQSVSTCNARPSVENAAQGSILLSASGDVSAPSTAYNCEELSMLDLIDPNLVGGQDNSMESIKNLSPLSSYDSRRQRSDGKTEPPTTERVYQKYDRNVNECGRESVSHNESSEGSKDVSSTSATDLGKSSCETKAGGDGKEKKISSPNLLPLPMHRNFASFKSIATKEKGSSSSLSLKPLNAPLTRKSSLLKSYQKPAKGKSLFTANDKSDKEDSTDSFHLPSFNLLPRVDTASSSTKSSTPNLVSSCTHLKNPKVISSEVQHTAMKDAKHTLLSSMMPSRVAKLNGNIQSSTMRIEGKSVKVSEGTQDAPQNATTSKPISSLNKEKHALLSPILKRKTPEGSVTDLKALNPLKRIMESPTEQRRSPDIKLESASDLVSITESQKAIADSTFTSNGLNVMGSISDFEMPSLVENDVNVEKAEACAKELDDICNMLKKKHEEAKELLVRAIVNNNALLMLNHPMYEEKIRALQRFATSLRSKDYSF